MSSYHNQAIAYRPEIDGLRAIAVLPVILFHAGFELFSGGYVGVDVFFVISGYLITSIILREMEQGKFSIVRFYERRARRILPALFFVIACCLPFAWMWMLPDELKRFGQSLVAVATFSSNIYFWRTTDYFAPAAEEQPLLHTWSLAVEEQYYVLFPLFLMLCWRFGKSKVFWLTTTTALLSILLAEWSWRNQPIANFYLLPTRAWELLSGSLIAFIPKDLAEKAKTHKAAQVFSATGLVLIFYAIFFFDSDTPVPSAYIIVPVLGSMLLIIFTNQTGFVGYLLTSKLSVSIGLISYSAYLWHQPIFAFLRIIELNDISNFVFGAVLTFSLSFVTWKFVELPSRTFIVNRLLVKSGILLISICSVGLLFPILSDVMRPNFRALSDNLVESHNASEPKDWKECLNSGGTPRNDFLENPCMYGEGKGASSSLVWLIGDSHAQVLHYELSTGLGENYSVALFAGGSCPPLFEHINTRCANFHREVKNLAYNLHPEVVVLSARWSAYARDSYFEFQSGGAVKGAWGFTRSEKAAGLGFTSELEHTIQSYLNINSRVFFITDYPTSGRNSMTSFLRGKLISVGGSKDKDSNIINRSEYSEWTEPTIKVIKKFMNHPNFFVVDSYKAICSEKQACNLVTDEFSFLGDDNHASKFGQKLLSGVIAENILQTAK